MLSRGCGASVVGSVAVAVTGAKVDSVAAGAAGLVADPVGDAPPTAADVVLVGSGTWVVEPWPDAGTGAGAGDPWKACWMVVPLVPASETGCPMSAS
ncbi:MAG TPA: hypothetical protein VFN47_04855, partial [Pedococcus sp.]|nr:hypothetical protein [Pedococcus sp.]